MKHNLIKLFGFLLIISVCFMGYDVFALSCASDETDAILNHFKIKSNYDISSKKVTVTVNSGSFIVTYVDGGGILSTNPEKKEGEYEGVKYNYYSFNGSYIVDKSHPLTLSVKPGGVIKIGLTFFKTDNKNVKDSYTGCYSYDYWLKNKSNADIRTFETKKHESKTGKDHYIEIDVPKASESSVELKTNSNKNTYCKAITEGYNYHNKFDKNIMKHWSNSSEATAFYKKMIGDCWNDKVVYVYSESEIVSIIETTIKLWYNGSVASSTGLGTDEAWSINFDNVKAAAKSAGHAYYAEDHNSGADLFKLGDGNTKGDKLGSTLFSLKCNYSKNKGSLYLYKQDASGETIYSDGKPVYNIDANTENYYAVNVEKQQVEYVYNYTGSSSYTNQKKKKVTVCTTTCEEAVEVKYGPPIASKAGLCFEYQVQVTSRVKCDSEINPDGRPDKGEYCNPVPYCNRVPGYVHQGGPVEEYDKCINSCDGGKYTKSCSNKCYNKVYKNNNNASKTVAHDNAEQTLQKLSASGSESFVQVNNGVYIRERYNTIYWRKNYAGDDAVGYARYYLVGSERSRTLSDHGSYTYDGNGFKRAIYGDTLCSDACYYTGCGKDTYLNSGEMEKDYAKNIAKYNAAIAKCKVAASCTEKTANFKISVDYKTSAGTKTINYSESNLISDDDSTCANPTVPSSDNILLNYQGCYKNCGVGQQYHARWSFPGTWLNIKTGEVSYTKKPSDTWYEKTGKFCTPTTAKNVNEKWWNYYLNSNKSELDRLGIDTTEYSNKCITNGHGTINNPLSIDIINPTWNIHAKTRNFGYYGWNFDIECFYALNSCGEGTEDEYSSYKVRVIDRANMFPDKSGSVLSDYSATGRKPGFNWSSSSITNKNPDYVVNPPALISKIQKEAKANVNEIYNDANLDYEINLTKSAITELRKVKNYTGYTTGKELNVSDVKNGIPRYYSGIVSDLVRDYGGRRPSEETAQCNNIKDSSSGSPACDNYIE